MLGTVHRWAWGLIVTLFFLDLMLAISNSSAADLDHQDWIRDSTAPVLTLGRPGDFDDQHLFAPCVIRKNGEFWMYYCGSRGEVANRVFSMGLATSRDGVHFEKHPDSPVFGFDDDRHSVLTPTILSEIDGIPILINDKIQMWFSSTDFQDESGRHTLRHTQSSDGFHWEKPSAPLMENVYAPTILLEDGLYRMWYTDVSEEPWVIGYAESRDGKNWKKREEPCITIDQGWEEKRLFYPHVRKWEGQYLMWYGSYWTERESTTAIGFAASEDGLHWTKSPENPVLTPDPTRSWESHYTTSETVHRLPEGGWRIWYATRKAPPFVNKYFAIGTARME
ncbi:MAG: hypothetical protein H6751_06470 [Candidatus Omnitrophica bacterium]|nr:hypothetical protein [Candidatus Omnitrophota bacterium]